MKDWRELNCVIDMIGYADFYKGVVAEVVSENNGGVFVEAGVREGISARIIYEVLQKFNNWTLFLLDPTPEPIAKELPEIDERIKLVELPAEEVSWMLHDKSIDFLHIDADVGGTHDYELSKRIYDSLSPKLKDQCAIILHDCTDAFPGIVRLAQEIEKEGWKITHCPPADECPIAAPALLQRR